MDPHLAMQYPGEIILTRFHREQFRCGVRIDATQKALYCMQLGAVGREYNFNGPQGVVNSMLFKRPWPFSDRLRFRVSAFLVFERGFAPLEYQKSTTLRLSYRI
jgi:hypothetical protein